MPGDQESRIVWQARMRKSISTPDVAFDEYKKHRAGEKSAKRFVLKLISIQGGREPLKAQEFDDTIARRGRNKPEVTLTVGNGRIQLQHRSDQQKGSNLIATLYNVAVVYRSKDEPRAFGFSSQTVKGYTSVILMADKSKADPIPPLLEEFRAHYERLKGIRHKPDPSSLQPSTQPLKHALSVPKLVTPKSTRSDNKGRESQKKSDSKPHRSDGNARRTDRSYRGSGSSTHSYGKGRTPSSSSINTQKHREKSSHGGYAGKAYKSERTYDSPSHREGAMSARNYRRDSDEPSFRKTHKNRVAPASGTSSSDEPESGVSVAVLPLNENIKQY